MTRLSRLAAGAAVLACVPLAFTAPAVSDDLPTPTPSVSAAVDDNDSTATDVAVEDMEHCPAGELPTDRVYRGPQVWADIDGGTPTTPSAMGAWSNLSDMRDRGYWDPRGTEPWDFAKGFARLICGAAPNSEIKIGMYFVRALVIVEGAEEHDADAIWDALEWVKVHRNVKASMILEGQNSCVVAADGQSCSSPMSGGRKEGLDDVRARVYDRWKDIGDVIYCINGCMNTKRFGTYFYGIEHEKFVTISDTIWPNSQPGTGPDPDQHPLVISTSGNFARSQIRSYVQDAMFIYDDYKLWQQFDQRFDAMKSCALTKCDVMKQQSTYQALHLSLEGSRGIWASNIVRRATDAGKGTEVIFSPQRSTDANAYISQLDRIDCKVDKYIRIAMFNMTDGLAQQMANRLRDLDKAGCEIELLLSLPGGGRSLSDGVIKTLNSRGIDYKCTARSMHTKLILIGPRDSGAGSILEGTQNMSVSGQLYSDEHILSIKAHNVSKPGYKDDVAEVYGQYLGIFNDLKDLKGDDNRGASKARC